MLTDLALSATDDTERSYTGQVFESKEGHIMDENGSIKVTGESPFNYDDVITSIGGPDGFGYTYIDSDEENGPHYEWKDITGIGSAITFNGGTNPNDDGYSNSISMGMNFEFYGVPVTDIQVSTNGWVSFNNYSTSYLTNTGIPGTSDPNNIIAVLWDDLNGYEGTCYYYYDETENQFIVSWTDWGFYIYGGDSRRYDMQVILDGDDNSILLQYGDISEGEYDSDISVGIENADGDVGLEYAYDNFTGSGGLAIKFSYPLFWLTVDPTVGYVAPEGSQVFDVNFNSAELEQGTYYGEIRINTNDPNNGMFSVPCTLNVGPVGIDDYSSAVPNAFTLNQNYPNPFNPTTEISFGLPTAGHVSLEVYDVMGRKVSIVVDEEMAAGTHSIIWDGNNLSGEKVTSGVYFYKLSQGDNTTTKKMIMLK